MYHINGERHLGKCVYYIRENNEVIIYGMNLLNIKINSKLIDYKYVDYYFNSLIFKNFILDI